MRCKNCKYFQNIHGDYESPEYDCLFWKTFEEKQLISENNKGEEGCKFNQVTLDKYFHGKGNIKCTFLS